MENALLETGYGLRKLGVMVMDNATKILQMRQAREGKSNLCIDAVFNKEEEEFLEKIIPQLEGQTEKLKNPYPKGMLSRASWVIARLGGWKGYKTSRPPGMKTFKKGLDKFNDMFFGWQLSGP